MAEMIDRIPLEARWELATKGLTGAYTAISKVLKDAVGQEIDKLRPAYAA